ncbi:hypothetical protein [Bradyrhizobium sp.]|uniref:hypothetical protein n=1 Tax=Bradyrhizobium sp. TaxID=376 RepID=UPI0025BFF03A|nr:hypothetical protein [Bradyrhizobium sp.]
MPRKCCIDAVGRDKDSLLRRNVSLAGSHETRAAAYEAIFRASRRSTETQHWQDCCIEMHRRDGFDFMSALIELIYREYCRARLAELRLLVEKHG